MPAAEKTKGPASYFPSIEAKYGQPIGHWLQLVTQSQGMKHMEIVNWLKNEHGLGHGHANAIVAHALATAGPQSQADTSTAWRTDKFNAK